MSAKSAILRIVKHLKSKKGNTSYLLKNDRPQQGKGAMAFSPFLHIILFGIVLLIY